MAWLGIPLGNEFKMPGWGRIEALAAPRTRISMTSRFKMLPALGPATWQKISLANEFRMAMASFEVTASAKSEGLVAMQFKTPSKVVASFTPEVVEAKALLTEGGGFGSVSGGWNGMRSTKGSRGRGTNEQVSL